MVVAVMTTPPDPGAHGGNPDDGPQAADADAGAAPAHGPQSMGADALLPLDGDPDALPPLDGAGTGPAVGDPAWLGRVLDRALLDQMEARGIDLAGERGEYHTLVTDGPGFRAPLVVRPGPVEHRSGHALLGWEESGGEELREEESGGEALRQEESGGEEPGLQGPG
ncbi:MAG: hypothetical protein EA352_07930 [Gemmatimonadales bacterium]|nr:MAG: hypothetical protein EA352_07930 [Gemmatimonadales bacterium]